MAEVDPVILQLRADVSRYRSELRSTTVLVESSLRQQEQAVVSLERQIKASSGAIGGHLRGLAGSLAAGISARQIIAMADSYTRYTNQLRVAGLEGENLANVQERLFQVAQQNGVEIEAVGELYSRAAQNQKELGASTSDLIGLTRAVAASLRISGTSTQEASGALLQLGQALGSPRIQAEEFNSLLDTMQPLLREASKYIDGTGDSLSGLTRKIKDTKGEGVSNVELFRAITQAMDELEKKAAGANLTISGAFTNLSNALTKYIGEADHANGASAALAQALDLLATNLDTLANAAAVVAAVLAGRFVGGAVAAAAASVSAAGAAAGATTAFGAMAAGARVAGASMLAAFGGPIGIATALGIAIVALVQAQDDSTQASRAQAEALETAKAATAGAREAMDRLSSATGKAREEALAHARAKAEETKQMLAAARAAALEANAKVRAAQAEYRASSTLRKNLSVAGVLTGLVPAGLAGESKINEAEAQQAAALATFGSIYDDLEALQRSINGGPPRINAGAPAGAGGRKKTPGGGRSGPSAAEIEQRHAEELSRIYAEQLQDELAITQDAERRREIHAELDRIEYDQRLAQINNDKDFTAAQKKAQKAALDKLYGRSSGNGDEIIVGPPTPRQVARNREAEAEAQRRLGQAARDEAEALEAESQLADTRIARLAIERAITEQREIEARAALEAAIASGQVADATKARAALERKLAADRQSTDREYESPFQAYARKLGNQGDNIGDEVQSLVVQRLDEVDDAITDAVSNKLGVKDPLLKQLLNLFIQQTLIKPIADALSSATSGGGGIGGFFTSLFGSVFGRTSGGYVAPGQTVRVNEHRGGAEFLRMGSQGGTVIPLGQANAKAARSSAPVIQQTFVLDNRHGITTPQLLDYVNRTAQAKAAEAGAASYDRSMKDAPARVRQAQRFRNG